MPKPILDVCGKRQPRSLVVGLRRVVKDPRATVAQRLEACKLLAIVEGYIPSRSRDPNRPESEGGGKLQNVSARPPICAKNVNRLRELLEAKHEEKLEEGLPGA